jgi:hypothetical protein
MFEIVIFHIHLSAERSTHRVPSILNGEGWLRGFGWTHDFGTSWSMGDKYRAYIRPVLDRDPRVSLLK